MTDEYTFAATLDPQDRLKAYLMIADGRSREDIADYFGMTLGEFTAALHAADDVLEAGGD